MLQRILFFCCVLMAIHSQAQTDSSIVYNHQLSFSQRVDAIVQNLTLEEKVAQMLNHAPAIPRLGIPAYDWWNEVLHGVARTPFRTTVYPQAIAMAATWDTTSLFTMAKQSALEGRAIHNRAIALVRTGERYLGLTYWTPNINIFRDPRWGRGQETYGEDPFLTAMLGKAFVNGLQGNDQKYLLAAACAKHYAVHSGPEPSRHVFNAEITDYDLWNTYLPAFKELVVNAKVAGVMCAYNAFRKQPCCGSDALMNDILRQQWKFTGYVTSDCWGIDDFFKNHKTHRDAVAASADAVFHGTDVECGTDAYLSLIKAVKEGIIPESQIDISVKRLFMIRMRLGMFDPPSVVSYAQTPATVLESAAHQAHALQMARQSIVLLKNDRTTLPLKKNIKRIAVIGPNANNSIAVLGNYNGIPSTIVTVVDGIKNKLGSNAEVIYRQAINFTNDTLLVFTDISAQCSYNGQPGFQAAYYRGKELGGDAEVIQEKSVDHFWQEGQQVTGNIKANNFSARYATYYTADKDGYITFEVQADDGYKLIIDNKEVINAWQRNRWGARTYRLNIKKDSVYKIVLEYWQGEGKANVALRAGYYQKTDLNALAQELSAVDAIVYAGGISPQLEGEEMRVDYPGFNGGDRTSIQLPAIQTQLLQRLQSTGKPVVFVMMTGSAIAIPWEHKHIPAIINAWYGGQSAGTAIADVLFGDYNPAGRLPVTFYAGDNDLPAFEDYSMQNRTYRYFKGKALYPFGYGLSYTTFRYASLVLPATAKKGKGFTVKVKVTNTGKMDGEEVTQLYLSYKGQAMPVPEKALKGFRRIKLKAGESRVLQFDITPKELSIANEKGVAVYPSGKLVVSVGGGQPGTDNTTTSNVTSGVVLIN